MIVGDHAFASAPLRQRFPIRRAILEATLAVAHRLDPADGASAAVCTAWPRGAVASLGRCP